MDLEPEGVRYTLTLVDDRQQLHCADHPEPLLLGEWPADGDDWDPDTADAIQTVVREHQAAEHPDFDPAWRTDG